MAPVVPFPPVGGGHKRTLRLLEAIDRAGGRPHVLTTDHGGDPETLRRRGWAVDVLPGPPPSLTERFGQHIRRRPSPYLGAVAARLRSLASTDAAFVQFEHAQSAYYFEALHGARSVLSMHNVDSALLASVAGGQRPLTAAWARATNRWLATRAVEGRAVPRADAVLCVSERDRLHFAAFADRVLLVPNGVDDDLFGIADRPPEGDDVLFFGQFDYAPNAHGILRFLREGWPRVAAARPGARLRLAGAGVGDEVARAAAAAERVEVLGLVPSIAAELARCRVTVVPIWQGGGTRLKVLEALAAARPVVGTPLGVEGIGFEPGRHGLVGEDPPGLARAVERLLAAPEEALQLAREGRRLAERFRWAEALRPAEDLYRRLLAEPRYE